MVMYVLALGAAAAAQPSAPSRSPAPTSFFHAPSVTLAVEGAGPILFEDRPDDTVDPLTAAWTALDIGGWVHDPAREAHRFGIALGWGTAARSDARSLWFATPRFRYETGRSLVMRAGLGWAVAGGTRPLADSRGGPLGEIAFRLPLQGPGARWTVSPAVFARTILRPDDPTGTSAWLGASVELGFHPDRR